MTELPAVARPLAVFDLDGVLADVRHRLHHVAPTLTRKRWGAFFAAAPNDPVLPQGREAVERLAEVADIVYLSGRPESCRADTQAWLDQHELPVGPVLLRPPTDRRPGAYFKRDAVRALAETAPVSVVVDDDPQVWKVLTEAGFDVLSATWMDHAEALHRLQHKGDT